MIVVMIGQLSDDCGGVVEDYSMMQIEMNRRHRAKCEKEGCN